jgi:hypothetical protein
MKTRCCPSTPIRKIARSVHESARDVAREIARTDAYKQSRKDRKKVEMLFAHLKRILKLDRLRLRGPNGAHDEFLLAATVQNLRRMAMLQPPQWSAALTCIDLHGRRPPLHGPFGLADWASGDSRHQVSAVHESPLRSALQFERDTLCSERQTDALLCAMQFKHDAVFILHDHIALPAG